MIKTQHKHMKFTQLILILTCDLLALTMIISAIMKQSPIKSLYIGMTILCFLGTLAITHLVINELKKI